MLGAISTGHKIGLFVVGLVFILFALSSALLVPRYRPDFPGRRLGAFVIATAVIFVAMLAAVEFFAVEEEEGGAEAAAEAAGERTGATTTAGESAPGGVQAIEVSETEFKIALPKTTLAPGRYEFRVSNDGGTDHDLAIEGEGVDEKTEIIDPGAQANLDVELKPGTYDFYCSVPGHKEAGMDVKVTVG